MLKINQVCIECGVTANVLTSLKRFGKPPMQLSFEESTMGEGKCDFCGEKKAVTSPRDFFHPEFDLINKVSVGLIKDEFK